MLVGTNGDHFATTDGSGGGGLRLNGGAGGAAAAALQRRSPNSSSQYSSGQHWRTLGKKEGGMGGGLGGRCSWKFAAILFILLSVVLVSALAYTAGEQSTLLTWNQYHIALILSYFW